MEFVNVCRFCRRTIEKEFLYCPWCGHRNKSSTTNEEEVERVFKQLEEKQFSSVEKRISELYQILDDLEKYFDEKLK